MTRWSSQRYTREGRSKDVPNHILLNAVDAAAALHKISPRLPPIFTLKHMAHLTGVPYGFLRAVVSRDLDPYRVFKLKKATYSLGADRYRYICAPEPKLLRLQRWINREILPHLNTHEASHAYSEGSSILKAAKEHAGCKWMIKLDVTNFFEAILEPRVYKIFRDAGYQPLIAFELARLCTRIRPVGNPTYKNKVDPGQAGLPYIEEAIGHLPQGAATSPMLSNIAAFDLDKDLCSFALENNLVYTRYADDMVFSANSDFSRGIARVIIHQLYEIIRSHGLWPNRAKTKIIPPGARKVVLGLLVDGESPRLTNEYKQEVRTHLHFLMREDVGIEKHMRARGFDSVFGLRNFLSGKIAYAQHIEPAWAMKMSRALKRVKWGSPKI